MCHRHLGKFCQRQAGRVVIIGGRSLMLVSGSGKVYVIRKRNHMQIMLYLSCWVAISGG